ncbi:hypothetical protein LOK49_LG13G00399 [Camellia lanceoleosa]|uniref:Uncharacterized protein n=1 Tax=Camellia lanceoleosa TaxID=1840588 RepID=A0ACC0FL70_9ERIC|nr:hypothetical protein LOK49_LG13G00399 [Camellia lanceoleosa]
MQSGKFIACRKFQVTLISASDLEDVRKVFKMNVHARVSINSQAEKRTEADKHGGTSPKWSQSVEYTIGESAVIHHGLMLVIKLYCKRKLGDKYIGEVHTSIKELFDSSIKNGGNCSGEMTCPVLKGSNGVQGTLTFSYRFGDRINVKRPPKYKKLVESGAAVLLCLAIFVKTGVYLPIEEIPIFTDPEVIE